MRQRLGENIAGDNERTGFIFISEMLGPAGRAWRDAWRREYPNEGQNLERYFAGNLLATIGDTGNVGGELGVWSPLLPDGYVSWADNRQLPPVGREPALEPARQDVADLYVEGRLNHAPMLRKAVGRPGGGASRTAE